MSRMIDADVLQKDLDVKLIFDLRDQQQVRDIIKDQPTIEPERKKGKLKSIAFLTCECSECKAQFHELEYDNFCPNCGVEILKGE